MIRSRENMIGAWAFLIGVILSVVMGVFGGAPSSPYITWTFVVLGLVVGFFVAEKDAQTFLIAAVSLVIVSYIGVSGAVLNAAIGESGAFRTMMTSILGTLFVLFIPATIIVALKSVFSISKS